MSDNWDVEPSEIRALRLIAVSGGTEEAQYIHDISWEIDPSIAVELEYSIMRNVSYEQICKLCYIPMSKANFYQYQRKVFNKYRESLKVRNMWGK